MVHKNERTHARNSKFGLGITQPHKASFMVRDVSRL